MRSSFRFLEGPSHAVDRRLKVRVCAPQGAVARTGENP
jgi:hypothetical protein